MTKGGGFRVALAALVLSLTGYLVLVFTARCLSITDNAQFLLFWALLFGCYGVLSGVAQESTRAAAAHRNAVRSGEYGVPARRGSPATPLLIVNGLSFGLALAFILLLTMPLWEKYFAIGRPVLLGVFVICSVVGFGCHSAILGAAAGNKSWGSYALLIAGEGIVRLAAVGTTALLTSELVPFELAATLGGFAWLPLILFSKRTRDAATRRADIPWRSLCRNTVHAIVSSSSTALLVVGFPLLLRATSSAEVYAQSAALLLAVSVTRAPLMLPLAAFQNILVAYFMNAPPQQAKNQRSETRSAFVRLLKPFGLLLAIGSVAAFAAWFLGPVIMLLFGTDYRIAPWVMAALTFAGALIAALTLTGAATIAANKHGYCSGGWAIASVISVMLLFLTRDAGLDFRIVISLTVGPLAGALVHLYAVSPMGPAVFRQGARTSADT